MTDGHDPQVWKVFYWCLEAQLNYQQTQVIMFRYVSKMNQTKTGKYLFKRVTKQRVSQIEEDALDILKRMLIKKQLNF